jgi:hypothetical protein
MFKFFGNTRKTTRTTRKSGCYGITKGVYVSKNQRSANTMLKRDLSRRYGVKPTKYNYASKKSGLRTYRVYRKKI